MDLRLNFSFFKDEHNNLAIASRELYICTVESCTSVRVVGLCDLCWLVIHEHLNPDPSLSDWNNETVKIPATFSVQGSFYLTNSMISNNNLPESLLGYFDVITEKSYIFYRHISIHQFLLLGRFTKCLDIGMKQNWVLSDEQCSIRFRKVRREEAVKEEVLLVKSEPSPVNQSESQSHINTVLVSHNQSAIQRHKNPTALARSNSYQMLLYRAV